MSFNTYFIDFPTLSYTLTRKFGNSLPLDMPEALKWYPIRTEPPRIDHYRELPSPHPPPASRTPPRALWTANDARQECYRAINVKEEEREES